MKEYSISVVIPVYNTPPSMLEQCFNSVLQQSISVKQMAVIDDGSTNQATKDCLSSYTTQHPDLFQVYYREHSGIARTRNAGLEVVEGDYVCFLDSDDFWQENFLESLTSVVTSDIDIVFCGYQMVSFNGERLGTQYPAEQILQDPLRFPYYTCGCGSRLYRMEHLRKYNCVFPIGCIMEDEVFSNLSIVTARKTASVIHYGYCVRERNDSFARSRRTFNTQTMQSIPLEAFRQCLTLAETAPRYQRNVVHYRILHSLMISSWVFCCFTPMVERAKMVKAMAAFLRQEAIDVRSLPTTHRLLQAPFARLLAMRVFAGSVRLHIDKPVAYVASFCVRLVYRLKGVH